MSFNAEPVDLFVVSGILIVMLSFLVLRARRRLWVKIVAIVIPVLLFASGYIGYLNLLSKPKPVEQEYFIEKTDEPVVLSFYLAENKAIYLLLLFSGIEEPRYFVLSWDLNLAKQLQRASREAEKKGTRVKGKKIFEGGFLDEREKKFYAAPQEALPPKVVPEQRPQLFTPTPPSQ